jgi:predicted NAD/FAD-dependent oxidoreductase
MVLQMSPSYSISHFESQDSTIVDEALVHVERLYGISFSAPVVSAVHRWKYSQPETTPLFTTVNQPGTRVIVAGDGVIGGRTELAYDSGLQAANMLLEHLCES